MQTSQLSRVALLAGLLVWAFGLLNADMAAAGRWGRDYFPNATVVTQDGKELNFYDDLIKDKIFVISFLYTSCKDICPLATARLAEVQEKLGDRVGRDIFIYSISIDPENDTPQRLKQYADTFRAGPGWLFLTGKPADMEAIRYKLGERSRFLAEHRNEVLLGNGKTGEWARNSVLGDLEQITVSIRAMDPNWRPDMGKTLHSDRGLNFDFSAHPGQALFKRMCAGCHTVGQGDRVGPDLAGVTSRRERSWLMKFIREPDKLRAQNDPIALALVQKFPTVRMPNLQIAESDAADLLTYVDGPRGKRPVEFSLEPLQALTTQDGKRLAREEISGRPLAVVFGFTHCPDVCPTALLDWSNVLASLGPDGDRLKVLFVSVDSQRDTPEALKAYLSAFDPRIVALTGSAAEVAAAAHAFDAFYQKIDGKDGGFTYDHTVHTYLVDRDGRRAGTTNFNSDEAQRRALLAKLLAQPTAHNHGAPPAR